MSNVDERITERLAEAAALSKRAGGILAAILYDEPMTPELSKEIEESRAALDEAATTLADIAAGMVSG